MSEWERNLRNLHRFSEMDDVEVAEDDPDVRGWDVVTNDGRDIGEVKDLLVDTTSMKVRCLEVELEGSHFNWNDNRRVAIPVESVRLDEEHDDVVIHGMALDEIGRLDEYRSADYSSPDSAARFSGVAGETFGGDPDYSIGTDTSRPEHDRARLDRDRDFASRNVAERDRLTRSEEEVNIGKRDVQSGEVRIGKHVETERVSQPVTRRKERVSIERRPASGDIVGSEPRFENDEIRVPVTEEQVIVEKRPVVKEELVISKDQVEETDHVDTEVRKERFDIQKDGRVLDKGDDTLRDDTRRRR